MPAPPSCAIRRAARTESRYWRRSATPPVRAGLCSHKCARRSFAVQRSAAATALPTPNARRVNIARPACASAVFPTEHRVRARTNVPAGRASTGSAATRLAVGSVKPAPIRRALVCVLRCSGVLAVYGRRAAAPRRARGVATASILACARSPIKRRAARPCVYPASFETHRRATAPVPAWRRPRRTAIRLLAALTVSRARPVARATRIVRRGSRAVMRSVSCRRMPAHPRSTLAHPRPTLAQTSRAHPSTPAELAEPEREDGRAPACRRQQQRRGRPSGGTGGAPTDAGSRPAVDGTRVATRGPGAGAWATLTAWRCAAATQARQGASTAPPSALEAAANPHAGPRQDRDSSRGS
jgi:hypothetical protein